MSEVEKQDGPPERDFRCHLEYLYHDRARGSIDGTAVKGRLEGRVPERLAGGILIGLIAVLILQPFLSDVPFSLVDVVVVFAMGLICFIPFVLFARGVVRS